MHNQAVVIRSQQRPVCTRRPTGAGGVNGGCARKGAAQAPSGRSTKHSRLQSPGSTLPAYRTPKQQACSQRCQGPASSAASADARWLWLWLWLCSTARSKQSSARYARLEAAAEGPRGGTACLRASGCSGQPDARCVSLCLHQEASTGAQGTQRPLQHREAF